MSLRDAIAHCALLQPFSGQRDDREKFGEQISNAHLIVDLDSIAGLCSSVEKVSEIVPGWSASGSSESVQKYAFCEDPLCREAQAGIVISTAACERYLALTNEAHTPPPILFPDQIVIGNRERYGRFPKAVQAFLNVPKTAQVVTLDGIPGAWILETGANTVPDPGVNASPRLMDLANFSSRDRDGLSGEVLSKRFQTGFDSVAVYDTGLQRIVKTHHSVTGGPSFIKMAARVFAYEPDSVQRDWYVFSSDSRTLLALIQQWIRSSDRTRPKIFIVSPPSPHSLARPKQFDVFDLSAFMQVAGETAAEMQFLSLWLVLSGTVAPRQILNNDKRELKWVAMKPASTTKPGRPAVQNLFSQSRHWEGFLGLMKVHYQNWTDRFLQRIKSISPTPDEAKMNWAWKEFDQTTRVDLFSFLKSSCFSNLEWEEFGRALFLWLYSANALASGWEPVQRSRRECMALSSGCLKWRKHEPDPFDDASLEPASIPVYGWVVSRTHEPLNTEKQFSRFHWLLNQVYMEAEKMGTRESMNSYRPRRDLPPDADQTMWKWYLLQKWSQFKESRKAEARWRSESAPAVIVFPALPVSAPAQSEEEEDDENPFPIIPLNRKDSYEALPSI